jgi:anti-anti-sigma factor
MVYVVVFSGDYDVANKVQVRQALRRHESSANLVLDLTKVSYIDSTFLAELLLLEKTRQANGFGPLTIVTPAASPLRRLFDVTGITATLKLVESFDSEEDPETIVEHASAGDEFDRETETRS